MPGWMIQEALKQVDRTLRTVQDKKRPRGGGGGGGRTTSKRGQTALWVATQGGTVKPSSVFSYIVPNPPLPPSSALRNRKLENAMLQRGRGETSRRRGAHGLPAAQVIPPLD